MKKILLSVLFASSMLGAYAEDVIFVEPFATTPGAGAGSALWAKINLFNEHNCAGLSYDLHLPVGFDFYSEGTASNTHSSIARVYDEDNEEVFALTSIVRNPQTAPDGHKFVKVAIAGTKNVTGSQGPILRFRLKVADDVTPGVYPITISNFFYNGSNTATEQFDLTDKTFTSYVVVGDAHDATLLVTGELPSYVNNKLKTEAAVTKVDLSAATASYGTFTYVDGREVVAPTADFAATAAYSKTVSKYASLTMPFAADLTDKGAYVLDHADGTTAFFNEATTVNAGDVVLLTQNVNLVGNKIGAATKSVQPEAYYVAPDGQSLHKGTNVTVPALRGYWNVGGGASNLRIALDGVLTDINMVDVQGEGADAFDLQGRRTANAKNGVFVVNGKKQFVK